jgi:hypothetical protein
MNGGFTPAVESDWLRSETEQEVKEQGRGLDGDEEEQWKRDGMHDNTKQNVFRCLENMSI